MTSPSLLLPFSIEYADYSMHIDELVLPTGCHLYTPDNADDGECRLLIQPAPELGSAQWTDNHTGKRILIGVYRDQGRKAAVAPMMAMEWSCDGTDLIIIPQDIIKHVRLGEAINIFINSELFEAKVKSFGKAGSDWAFSVKAPIGYADFDSGTGTFSPVEPINFYEDYIIFRQLSSMRVLSIEEAQALLAAWYTQPVMGYDSLVDPFTNTVAKVPRQPYRIRPTAARTPSNHRQQFDENNRPLRQNYDAKGRSIPTKHRHTRFQNKRTMYEPDTVPNSAGKLRVFDYYGFALNDSERLPYLSEQVIVYDASEPTGIRRTVHPNGTFYNGPLFDEFGLPVIGAADMDQLVLRDSILPVRVDQFNVPLKTPQGQGSGIEKTYATLEPHVI
jgi:hypothetical protein